MEFLKGLGGTGSSQHVTKIWVNLPEERKEIPVQAFVIRSLGIKIPKQDLKINQWSHLMKLNLADPQFFKSQSTDLNANCTKNKFWLNCNGST